ncbi:hypothetical protein Q9R32_07915 [Actinotalea sp. AC32]|nr:hypothetical protein [Actinotalea sp. AC32]
MQPTDPHARPAGPVRPETPRDDRAGLTVLGRLLWVGVVAGLLVGGLSGAALSWATPQYAVGAFSAGAVVGGGAGVAVQVANAVVLHGVVRARPRLDGTRRRVLLVPLPALTGVALLLALGAPGVAGLAVGALCVAVAWLLAPWCLAPAERARAHPRSDT